MLERSTSKIPRVVEEANRFESKCDVHLYTFGSDHGWPATLDPFVNLGGDPAYCDETGKEKAYEKLTRDAKCKLHGEIRIFVVDLLTSVALIKVSANVGRLGEHDLRRTCTDEHMSLLQICLQVDEKGGEILASNNIPSLLKRSLQHVSLEDKKVLATDLVSAVWQVPAILSGMRIHFPSHDIRCPTVPIDIQALLRKETSHARNVRRDVQ
jgi:hypothetical protein